MSALEKLLKTIGYGSGVLLMPLSVYAQGLVQAPAPSGTLGGSDLIGAIFRIVNWFLILVSVVAVVYLILGGLRYITSQGDSDQAEQAKQTILFAIIGLIVIGLAAVVVNFTLRAFGGGGF